MICVLKSDRPPPLLYLPLPLFSCIRWIFVLRVLVHSSIFNDLRWNSHSEHAKCKHCGALLYSCMVLQRNDPQRPAFAKRMGIQRYLKARKELQLRLHLHYTWEEVKQNYFKAAERCARASILVITEPVEPVRLDAETTVYPHYARLEETRKEEKAGRPSLVSPFIQATTSLSISWM